uniref:EF-hand domain-containing protein n=1 Tax=Aureoumbra lagunensis TaxID=44058 RepID=A0A7S3NNZ0_9STRA
MDELIHKISLKRHDPDHPATLSKVTLTNEAKEEPIIQSHSDKVAEKWEKEQQEFQQLFMQAVQKNEQVREASPRQTTRSIREETKIAEAPAPPPKQELLTKKPRTPQSEEYPVEQHVAEIHPVKPQELDEQLFDDKAQKSLQAKDIKDNSTKEENPYTHTDVVTSASLQKANKWGKNDKSLSLVCAEAVLNKAFGKSDRPKLRPEFTKLDPDGTGTVSRKQFAWIIQQHVPNLENENMLALMQNFAATQNASSIEYMPFIRFCEHRPVAHSAAVSAAKRFAFHMGMQQRLVQADRDRMGSLPLDVFAMTLRDAGIDLDTTELDAIARLFPAKATSVPLSSHSVSVAYPAFGEYVLEQEASLQLRRLENRIRNAAQKLSEKSGKDALRALFRSSDTRGKPALGHRDLARFFESLLESSITDEAELNALIARYMGRDAKDGVTFNEVLDIMKQIPLPIAATANGKPDWKHMRARARAAVLEAADRMGSTAAKTAIDGEFMHFDWRGTSLVHVDEFVVAALRAGIAITRADLATIGRRFAQHDDDPNSKIAYTRFLAWATSSNAPSKNIDLLLQKFDQAHPEFYRAFRDYDIDDRQSINYEDFRRACIRDLGVIISDDELRTVADQFLEPRATNRIKYDDFIHAVKKVCQKSIAQTTSVVNDSSQLQQVCTTIIAIIKRGIDDGLDVRSLFEDRDEGYTGVLGKKDFAQIMRTNLGARCTDDEIDLLASRFGGDSSCIHYIEMLNTLIPIKSGDGWRLEERLRAMIKRKFDWWVPGRLRKAFRHFDIKKKGLISQSELADGLSALKLKHSAEQLYALFSSMDLDKDGLISCSEFIIFVKDPWHHFIERKIKRAIRNSALSSRDARRIFDDLDRGGTGLFGRRDFATALTQLGVAGLSTSEIQRLAQRFDIEDDGNVMIERFFNFLQGTTESTHSPARNDNRPSPHTQTPILRLLRTEIRRIAQHRGNGRGPNYGAAFRDLDRDGSGRLNRREFRRALESFNLNLSSADLTQIIDHFDSDGDGHISYREFVKFADANLEDVVSKIEDAVRAEIKRIAKHSSSAFASVFRAFDENGSGIINRQEFKRGLEKLGFELDESLLQGLIDRFDVDGDGRIDYDEFVRFFKAHGSNLQEDDIDALIHRLKRLVQDATEKGGATLFDCFRHFDVDGSGDVDEIELLKGMRRLGIELTAYEAKKLAERFPSRRSGSIKYHDFCQALGSFSSNYQKNENLEQIIERFRRIVKDANIHGTTIAQCFEHFDIDGSGGIDAEELRQGLKKLDLAITDSQIACLIEAFVGSRRGHIRYRDFVRAICPSPDKNLSPNDHSSRDIKCADVVKKVRREIHRAAEHQGVHCTKKYLRQIFLDMDDNGSGKVNRKELRRGLERIGLDLTSSELNRVLDELDRNGDGRCSFSEFETFFHNSMDEDRITEIQAIIRNEVRRLANSSRGIPSLRLAFAAFDKNDSGHISRRELRNELEKLGIELSSRDIDAVLDRFDLDGDGKIDYREFARFAQGGGDGLREDDCDELFAKIKRGLSSSSPDIVRVFSFFDRDGSGIIDDEEFQRGLAELGLELTAYETKKLLDRFPGGSRANQVSYRCFIQALGFENSRHDYSTPEKISSSRGHHSSGGDHHGILKRIRSELRRLAERRNDEKPDFTAVFREFDHNDSGTINRRELGRGLRALGIQHTSDDLDYVVNAFDQNGDGKISKREFLHFIKKRNTISDDDALARVRDLLREATKSGGKRPEEVLARFDRNASGTIDQDDFCKAMRKLDIPLSKYEISQIFERFAGRSGRQHNLLLYHDFLRTFLSSSRASSLGHHSKGPRSLSPTSSSRRHRRHHHHRRSHQHHHRDED